MLTMDRKAVWKSQFAAGRRAEHRIANYLSRCGLSVATMAGPCEGFDIIIIRDMACPGRWNVETVEIKNCDHAAGYGHIPIEFCCRGRPSGLAVSRADAWIFTVGETAYWIDADELRALISHRKYRTSRSSDGNDCWIIPILDIARAGVVFALPPDNADA